MTASSRPVVKLSTPADVVGTVPWVVGFHPQESLVVMSLRGPRLRTGLTMRVDLPPPEHEGSLASDLATRAARDGAAAVLLLCYTADPDRASRRLAPHEVLPRARLVDALVDELRRRGIGCKDALLVRGGRWHSYHCSVDECCPPGGRELPSSPGPAVARVAAEGVLSGRAPLSDREELERSVRGPVGLRGMVVVRIRDRLLAEVAAEAEADLVALRTKTLALLGETLRDYESGQALVDDETAVRIALGLRDRTTRDLASTWVLDAPPQALLGLLLDLARAAPDDLCAPVCTVLAWVAYAQGDGALANVAVDRALTHEPGYALAELLRDGLARQVPPRHVREVSRAVRRELGEAQRGA